MELKPGYKQTDVGVIPEDWDVVELAELKPFVTSGSRGWAPYYSDTGSLFVRIANLSRASIYLDLDSPQFVRLPADSSEGTRTQLREHDVLISITADIGIVGYVDSSIPSPAYINQHIALIRFGNQRASGKFIGYFLASDNSQGLIRAFADTGAKAGMNLLTMKRIHTALPPPSEQSRIGQALSNIDSLICSIEQLIHKKLQVKQAAMQELLTGKRRLPGFEGEWEARELGSLGIWRGGMTPSMQNPDYWNQGDFPWISSGDVKLSRLSDTSQHVTAHAVSSGAAVVIPVKSIVLVTRSGILRKHLPVAFLNRPMAINQDIKALIPARDIDSCYLLHALTWAGSQILISCMKTGTTVESVEFSWLKRFTILIPSHDEQVAIATALSEMESELLDLEARKDKATMLKQGMMHQLLTGKIRLK